MKIRSALLSLLLVLTGIVAKAQVSTIQFKLYNGTFKKPVKNANVKVLVNDTIEKRLITDEKGITGFIEVQEGTYDLSVHVEPYKDRVVKNVKISRATGKHLRLRLRKA